MRILIFTEVFYPKIDGVVTRVTRSLEQLAKMGHECMIVAPSPAPQSYAGFPVVSVPSAGLGAYPEVRHGWFTPHTYRVVRDFNPDIVHAVNPVWLAASGVWMARALGIPLVASYHTNVPDYMDKLGLQLLRNPAQKMIRILHNRAAANLVTSLPMVERATEVGINNVNLWPKAVDTVGFDPTRASEAMREKLSAGHPDDPIFLYVGRISKEKNLSILAPVMDRVRESLPNSRMAFVGSGPYEEELKAAFDPEFATLNGYMTGDTLAEAFASADVFAFPSTTETLGLVSLEAFASGTPVVGANAGGIPYTIVDGQTGYLVEPYDESAWADKLVAAFNDESMPSKARMEAQKYSWHEATVALVKTYEDAIRLTKSRKEYVKDLFSLASNH